MSTYRVDTHQPRNLYRGNEYIGVCFDPADTALIVDALEGHTDTPDVDHTHGAAEALAHVAERIANAADDFDADTLATLRIILEATAADLGIDEEAPSARASLPESAEQAPVGGTGGSEGAQAISGHFRFHVQGIGLHGAPGDLSLHCGQCPWTLHTNARLTLAELNRRADEHTEECR